MKTSMFVISLVLSVLCGCNGDGSGTDATVVANDDRSSQTFANQTLANTDHFEGNWQGTLTSDLTQTTSPAIALVNGWGEFRLVTDGAQFVGWPRRSATKFEGMVTGIRTAGSTWNDDTHSSIFTLGGDIAEDGFIEGRYEGGEESGTFALAWAADTGSRINSIVGTWVQYDDRENIVATFQIERRHILQARILGNHVNGCTYFGQTESWTSQYSYDVVPLEVSGCPLVAGLDPNGTFAGTAALVDLDDDSSEDPVLVIALSKDLKFQITLFLHRIPD